MNRQMPRNGETYEEPLFVTSEKLRDQIIRGQDSIFDRDVERLAHELDRRRGI